MKPNSYDPADLPYLIGFGWAGDTKVCHRKGCGSTLTAQQADGDWGCPWHFTGPVQMELCS